MVDGGGYANERSRQETCQKLSILLAVAPGDVRARPRKLAAMGDQAIAGRRPGTRRRARQCCQAAQRFHRYIRSDDLALGGLSLPRIARRKLARPSRVPYGGRRAPDAAIPWAGPLRGYSRCFQSRMEAGARA